MSALSLPAKVRVRWAIWAVTVDQDIVEKLAPATHRALQAGAHLPEVDVDTANKLMKAQQDRHIQWPEQ